MSTTVTSKADPRVFIILGIFSAIFLSIGVLLTVKQSDGWKALLFIVVLLSIFWAGALSVRFSFDEVEISYRSLFRRFTIATPEVTAIAIVVERKTKAPQGVPKFYLQLQNANREALNVKVIPLRVVRELCTMLTSRGVSVSVQDAFMAKRMASQIFSPKDAKA